MKTKTGLSLVLIFLIAFSGISQEKLLILHADDLGLAHSVNKATFQALDNGDISSASLMVPCPWSTEAAAVIRENKNYDIGIHLTLTSEWDNYKWGGVAPAGEIPSLLDKDGFFYATVAEVVQHAKPAEVEKELRAQIDRAIQFGVTPTHLDSHMGTLFARPEFFQIYLKLGKIYNIPVFLPKGAAYKQPQLSALVDMDELLIDQYYMMEQNRPADQWLPFYTTLLDKMPTGVNLIIVHLAYDNEEMQAVCKGHEDFGAVWRENDLNTVKSKAFKKALKTNNIKLTGWKDLK